MPRVWRCGRVWQQIIIIIIMTKSTKEEGRRQKADRIVKGFEHLFRIESNEEQSKKFRWKKFEDLFAESDFHSLVRKTEKIKIEVVLWNEANLFLESIEEESEFWKVYSSLELCFLALSDATRYQSFVCVANEGFECSKMILREMRKVVSTLKKFRSFLLEAEENRINEEMVLEIQRMILKFKFDFFI